MGWRNMLLEPNGTAENLIPIVVRTAREHNETKVNRYTGFSSCCQFILCLDGEGIFTDRNEQSHTIKKGDIFFVSPGTPHRYEPVEEPWRVQYATAAGYELDGILESFRLPKDCVLHPQETIVREMERLMSVIIEVYESKRIYRHIKASACFYKILALLAECGGFGAESEGDREKLALTVMYIKQHFEDEDLSSESIAKFSGMSASTLNRLFRKAYGMSPHEFITDIRLRHAKNLLCREKNETLQEIAELCGFRTSGYFIKVFKSKSGMTPTEFRRRNTIFKRGSGNVQK